MNYRNYTLKPEGNRWAIWLEDSFVCHADSRADGLAIIDAIEDEKNNHERQIALKLLSSSRPNNLIQFPVSEESFMDNIMRHYYSMDLDGIT